METSDLPLFDWRPHCIVIAFPADRRIGRVRDVALKLLDKPTQRAALSYRRQVINGLTKQLAAAGLTEQEFSCQVAAFMKAVDREQTRLSYQPTAPGGAA